MSARFEFCAAWITRDDLYERVHYDRMGGDPCDVTAYRFGPFALVVSK